MLIDRRKFPNYGFNGGINPPFTPPFNPNSGQGYPMGGGPPMPSAPVPIPQTGGGGKPAGPRWLQKLTGGFNSVMGKMAGPEDPNLSPQDNAARRQQQQQMMMAALMQSAAPRPQGTGSPIADFGSAMMAGQQAGQQYSQDALRSQVMQAQMAQAQGGGNLIGSASPSDFTPESLAKYQQSGNPADLVPIERNTLNRVNPRDYTPESLAKYMETGNLGDLQRVAPYQASQNPGGGTDVFDPITGTFGAPARTAEEGTAQAAARSGAESRSRETGAAQGRAEGAILAKATNAQGIQEILDIADPLIDEATGSGSGAARDKLAAFFGASTEGDQAIGQLRVLQAALMMAQPRMEGPQSDKDVELYRQAAAELGDPTVPNARKKAAVRTIRDLQAKYAERVSGAAGGFGADAPAQAPNAAPSDDPLGLFR